MLRITPSSFKTFAVIAGLVIANSTLTLGQNDPLDSGGELLPEQAAYNVHYYDIDLFIEPSDSSLHGSVITHADIVQPLEHFVLDLDTVFTVNRVVFFDEDHNQVPLQFETRHGQIWASFPTTRQPGDKVIIEVEYEGKPRVAPNPPWEGGFTWAQTADGHPWIDVTCQLNGADIWWPVKDHPSDRADSISINVSVPGSLVVAGPGKLRQKVDHDNGYNSYSWFVSNPINNYALSINIGPYETIEREFQSTSGESFPMIFWVLPENYENANNLFGQIKEHMAFYEEYLGPYPFQGEKYGIVESPHLGMEHQTLIAYGAGYQDDVVFGTDSGFDDLHHHELGHEWWGNMVSAYDWRDFWIHEGFCTYMQPLYAEYLHGPDQYRKFMNAIRERISNNQPVAPRESKSSREMYGDRDVYMKGAWFLHTLRYLIGDEIFFTALRRMAYPEPQLAHLTDGSNSRFATTDDFLTITQEVSGRQLDWLFEVYLRQEQLPTLRQESEGNKLTLSWSVPDGLQFPMPVEIEVDGVRQSVQVPGDGSSVTVEAGRQVRVDPDGWILKK